MMGLAPQFTRTQDAFRWLDLRPCDRSRLARATLTFARTYPAPFSPTANRSKSSPLDRRVKLTQAFATTSRPALPAQEDASTQRLQPIYNTSTPMDRPALESPPSPAFTDDDSFHTAHQAETWRPI